MFLLGWMIDGVLTVIGCILLACAFGNSPITFLFFFVFPIAFILIWYKEIIIAAIIPIIINILPLFFIVIHHFLS